MNNNSEEETDKSSTLLLVDCFLQLMALQKTLISKGIFTNEEIKSAVDNETSLFLKPFLEKAGVQNVEETLDTIIKNRKL